MLTTLLIMVTLQAAEPHAEAKQPTPPIDTKALARRLDREFAGQELRLIADLRRHPRSRKLPGTTASAVAARHVDDRAPRVHRAGERVRILEVRRDREGLVLRVGPPGYDADRLMAGGDADSSVRLPPSPIQEVGDTYDLFEKSARREDREARDRRVARARILRVLLTGTTEEEYRAALRQLFKLQERQQDPSPSRGSKR